MSDLFCFKCNPLREICLCPFQVSAPGDHPSQISLLHVWPFELSKISLLKKSQEIPSYNFTVVRQHLIIFFFSLCHFLLDSTDGFTAIFTWGYSSQRFFLCVVWEREKTETSTIKKTDRQTDRQTESLCWFGAFKNHISIQQQDLW